jgi:hypothetical protein
MATRIKARFATARDTAAVLGVSKSRFKLLERLAHSNSIFKAADIASNHASRSGRSAKHARTKPASLKYRAKVSSSNRRSKARPGKGRSGAKA